MPENWRIRRTGLKARWWDERGRRSRGCHVVPGLESPPTGPTGRPTSGLYIARGLASSSAGHAPARSATAAVWAAVDELPPWYGGDETRHAYRRGWSVGRRIIAQRASVVRPSPR